jgi:diguanylate cyclase (GGDEF)-like protein
VTESSAAHDDASGIDASPGAERAARLAQLLQSPRTQLRLPTTLESAFRLHFLELGRSRLRFGMATGLLLFACSAVWDVATFPPEVLRWTLALRFGLASPLLAIVLVSTYRSWSPTTVDRLRLAMALGVAITVVAITAVANAAGIDAQPHGLFVIAIASYTITGMRVPQAVLGGISVLVLQIVCDLLTGNDIAGMVEPVVFILVANTIGYAAAVGHERAARTSFLQLKLLECRADQDGLTGIANRRTFDAAVKRAFDAAAREKVGVTLAIFDVDHFKDFNDHRGHLEGDDCLRRIAQAAELLARRPMDAAARIGGEEFALIWYDASAEDAARLAEEIRAAVEALAIERPDAAPRNHVTVSVGATHARDGHPGALDALAAADEALYEAKAAGRDRVAVRIL